MKKNHIYWFTTVLIAMVLPFKLFAQAPNISYSTPPVYTLGAAIATLTPVNTGGAVPLPGQAYITQSLVNPAGIAVDAAGYVYIAEAGNNDIKKVPAAGGTKVIIGSGFNKPTGVAVDAAGNIYIADNGNNAVKKIPVAGGTILTLGSGFSHPYGIAVDAGGNIYVSDAGNNAVKMIPAGSNTPVTLGSGFSNPQGVAVDAAGNVYVADQGNNMIKKIPAGNGAPVSLATGSSGLTGVAVDAAGDIYFVDSNSYSLFEIKPGASAVVENPLALYGSPTGLAINAIDDVFIDGSGLVVEYTLNQGYSIAPNLPVGLSFDGGKGIISGTPLAVSPSTNYSVTAKNASGSNTTTINIAVSIPAAKPNISYSTPPVYAAGVPVAPTLKPLNKGGGVAVQKTAAITFSAYGIAVDAADSLYGSWISGNTVNKYNQSGYFTHSTIGTGFTQPIGIAVDAAGNVYVADNGNSTVREILASSGATVILGTGFSQPNGIAVDAAGNIYVGDSGNNAVKMMPAGGGTPVTLGSGFSGPTFLAVDAAGNVYVNDAGNGALKKIPAGNGTPVTISSDFNKAAGVAVDAVGNVYVVDGGNNLIKEFLAPVNAGSRPEVLAGTGFNNPVGIAIDASGDIFVADYGNGNVKLVNPGDYAVAPYLPAGVTLNKNTGVVSGTAIMASPAANYTIVAANAAGSSTSVVNIAVNLPAKPVISYGGPQAYTVGQTISPLVPSNSGGAVATPQSIILSTGFAYGSLAVDNAGNQYVAAQNNTVEKFPATGGSPIAIGSGFNGLRSVGVDAAGNVYVLDLAKTIHEIPIGGGPMINLGTGLLNPNGMAVDAAGNVYVSDWGNNVVGSTNNSINTVKRIAAGTNTTITLAKGFVQPSAIAADAAGNVFLLDYKVGNSSIYEVLAINHNTLVRASGITAFGVAIDASDNIYFTSGSAIQRIPAGGGTPVTISVPGTINNALIIVTDVIGNIYAADQNNTNLTVITPGSYFVNPALPAGLVFNNSTGTISGKPTTLTAAANYTVTAYNSGGISSATVNIGASSGNSYLSNLKISVGDLAPAFSYLVNSYTASVPNTTASITVTPVVADSTSSVTINGKTVSSNTASTPITLAIGANTITTVVTAQNGTATTTYSITVTRAANNNATLASLGLNSGTLSPAFAAGTISYTASVASTVSSIKVTPKVASAGATVKVNGTAVASGVASAAIPLAVGENKITITVTASDASSTNTYIIQIKRAQGNAYLSNLKFNSGTLSPAFNYLIGLYTVSVTNATASIKATAVAAAAGSTININGTQVTSGTSSAAIPLAVGDNTIKVGVVSAGNVNSIFYTVIVTRALSDNAALTSFQLKPFETLTKVTGPHFADYTVSVPNNIPSVSVIATTADPGAFLFVNSEVTVSGTASNPVPLNAGQNSISILVESQDKMVERVYFITITKAPSTNAILSKLSTTPVETLTAVAGPGYKNYTASVPNTVTQMKVLPVTVDPTATIKVNGATVASGAGSAWIPLAVGSNTLTTVVTAQDGVTSNSYIITVTRAAGPVNIPDEEVAVALTNNPTLANDGIIVHQAVSPNGDGVNDYLTIENIANYPDNNLMIMNPGGTLVYEGKGYDNQNKVFDGHSNKTGKMQLPGTYFYSLDYTVKGVIKHKTGFIVLKY